jgi:hypothetical protein
VCADARLCEQLLPATATLQDLTHCPERSVDPYVVRHSPPQQAAYSTPQRSTPQRSTLLLEEQCAWESDW